MDCFARCCGLAMTIKAAFLCCYANLSRRAVGTSRGFNLLSKYILWQKRYQQKVLIFLTSHDIVLLFYVVAKLFGDLILREYIDARVSTGDKIFNRRRKNIVSHSQSENIVDCQFFVRFSVGLL